MAQATPRDLHVDGLLTNISLGAYNAPSRYIAREIAPVVPVAKQSDIVPKYDQSHWFRNEARPRAPGEASHRGGWATDLTNTYYAKRVSYGHEISDDERSNSDAPFDQDRDATLFVTDKIMMHHEIAWASTNFTTSVWGADRVGGSDFTVWSDYANSSPLTDIDTFGDNVDARIAMDPNTFVMGKQVWMKLKRHPDVIDLIKYTQRGQLTLDLFAALIEIPRVLVGKAIYTASPEGTAEASVSYSRIWGKHALLLFRPDAPSLMTPAATYTFTWRRVPNSLVYIKRMRDEEREVDIIEANTYFDFKVTSARAGEFLSGAVA
jgi:hypothetical protein